MVGGELATDMSVVPGDAASRVELRRFQGQWARRIRRLLLARTGCGLAGCAEPS